MEPQRYVWQWLTLRAWNDGLRDNFKNVTAPACEHTYADEPMRTAGIHSFSDGSHDASSSLPVRLLSLHSGNISQSPSFMQRNLPVNAAASVSERRYEHMPLVRHFVAIFSLHSSASYFASSSSRYTIAHRV